MKGESWVISRTILLTGYFVIKRGKSNWKRLNWREWISIIQSENIIFYSTELHNRMSRVIIFSKVHFLDFTQAQAYLHTKELWLKVFHFLPEFRLKRLISRRRAKNVKGGQNNELFLWLFENFWQKPVTLVHWNSKRNFESIRSTEAVGYDELILDNSRWAQFFENISARTVHLKIVTTGEKIYIIKYLSKPVMSSRFPSSNVPNKEVLSKIIIRCYPKKY